MPQHGMNPQGRDSANDCSRLIAACRGKRVVVFGDLIADEFVYGRIARVSREAPVLILEYDSTEIVPGGAGNAANNVAASAARCGWCRWSAATSRAAGCSRCCRARSSARA